MRQEAILELTGDDVWVDDTIRQEVSSLKPREIKNVMVTAQKGI